MSNKASPNKRMKNLTDFFGKTSDSTKITPTKKKIITPIKKYQLVIKDTDIDNQLLRRRKANVLKLEQNLKKTNRHFSAESKMDNHQAKKLAEILKSSNRFQRPNLDFTASKKITNAGFKCILESLKKFTHLKVLKLNFRECLGITETGLCHLYLILKKFTRLKALTLSFEGCWIIAFKNGLVPLGDTFQKLCTLRILNLNFESCWLTDPALCNLGRNLKKLPLTSLTLNLNACSLLRDEGTRVFCKDLAQMESLQSLNVGLSSIIQQNLMYQLTPAIKNLVYLRDLNLNFDWGKTLNDSFYILLKEMLQALPYLQSVNFSFHAHEWVVDSTLKLLSQGLRDAVSLKSVELNFRSCQRIATEPWSDTSGLEALSQTLGRMTGLENIEIDLSSCGLNKKRRDDFKKPLDGLKKCRKNIIFRRQTDD